MSSCCKNCLLPSQVPNSDIKGGLCQHCRTYDVTEKDRQEEKRKGFERDLEETLTKCERRPDKFDAIVCVSGGKDSAYLLYKLKVEYGLHVLAYTHCLNVRELARENVQRIIRRLDVEHINYRTPDEFARRAFRYLFKNQDPRGAYRSICYNCAPMMETDALRIAVEREIPLVFLGYGPGQPDPEYITYEHQRSHIEEKRWAPQYLIESGEFSDEELDRFYWNPHKYPKGTKFPRLIAPFHAWSYNQDEVVKKVVELGLISTKKKAHPAYTNCALGWLIIFSDIRHLGYYPLMPEMSGLIRSGRASRFKWIILNALVHFMAKYKVLMGKDVKKSLKWLDLKEEELGFRKTSGMLNSYREDLKPLNKFSEAAPR